MVFYEKKTMKDAYDEVAEEISKLVEEKGFSTAEALEILKIIKLDKIEQEIACIE